MVVPGLRSRIATGLLVVAVALPLPMTAGPAMAVGVRTTPATRPDEPMDDYASDASLAVGHAVEGYPGHPRVSVRLLPGFSGNVELRDLPDRLFVLPGSLPGFLHHPGGPFRYAWRHHPHHPFGPSLNRPRRVARHPADRVAGTSDANRSEPAAPPAVVPARRPAPSPAPVPRHSAAPRQPGTASARPERPSPSHDRDVAGPLPSPYQSLPSPAPEQKLGTAAGAAPEETRYALEAPAARVERVLPMGAGMALTGLGLAFLGLRLRRR